MSAWADYRPLAVLIACGLLLRIVVTVLYFPTALQWVDAIRFSRLGQWHSLFSDYYVPAGYAVFLKITHWITSNVVFTISVQHLLGLVAGVLVYWSIARLGGPRWLGLIPAALAVLGGGQLYLEHLLMSDSFFAFMVVAGLAVAVHGLTATGRARLIALAGAGGLLACAGLVRQAGLGVVVAVALTALMPSAPSVLARLSRPAAVLIAATAVVLLYVATVAASGGKYTGLTDMGGWNLYARVAPFADCNDFTPPKGTRILCEPTPPSQRLGSFYYAWSSDSWGWSKLGDPTPNNEVLATKFADAVVEHQPLDYAKTVVRDVLRYADPNGGTEKVGSGQGPDTVSFEQGVVDPATASTIHSMMKGYWSDLAPHMHDVQLLAWYESLTTPLGLLWAVLAGLVALGSVLARGTHRMGTVLFGLSALAIYVVPAMTLSWDFRYGIPAQVPLFAAAACAGLGLYTRAASRRDPVPRDVVK
jgi:hypothetical protein